MEQIPTETFLAFAASLGIAPDMRYQEPRSLVYPKNYSSSRFWPIPESCRKWPSFIQHMLDGIAPAIPCHLWPRGGSWTSPTSGELPNPRRVAQRVQNAIAHSAGIPSGYAGALKATSEDMDSLLSLIYAQVAFGVSVRDDLFVVPNHGRAFLHVDHHDAIIATFAEDLDLERFISHMSAKGYELPDAPPDGTFKHQEWMRPRKPGS